MTEICFGTTKMGIFYREKAFHAGEKKIWKNDIAPSEKCACYTPDWKDTYGRMLYHEAFWPKVILHPTVSIFRIV